MDIEPGVPGYALNGGSIDVKAIYYDYYHVNFHEEFGILIPAITGVISGYIPNPWGSLLGAILGLIAPGMKNFGPQQTDMSASFDGCWKSKGPIAQFDSVDYSPWNWDEAKRSGGYYSMIPKFFYPVEPQKWRGEPYTLNGFSGYSFAGIGKKMGPGSFYGEFYPGTPPPQY